MDNLEESGDEKTTNLVYLFKILRISLLFFSFILGLFFTLNLLKQIFSDFENAGQFGDFFNGITTPFLTVVAVYFAYRSFSKQSEQLKNQQEEMKKQEEEIKKQREDIKKQRFSDTFFQLLNLQNNIIDNLKYEKSKDQIEIGRNIFKEIYYELIHIYNEEKPKVVRKDLYKHCFEILDDKHKDKLSHYYRNLYQLFYWINANEGILEKKERFDFVKFIRAQLSHYEIDLLYFNTNYFINNPINYFDIENERFLTLLNKYEFFKFDENSDESIITRFNNNARDEEIKSLKSASDQVSTTE